MSLSDEQKQRLSATAKGRSRNSRGQFVDTVTAQEARIQEVRIAELQAKLSEVATVAEARVARAYTEGVVMTLLISFTAAVLAFFVGRWAR